MKAIRGLSEIQACSRSYMASPNGFERTDDANRELWILISTERLDAMTRMIMSLPDHVRHAIPRAGSISRAKIPAECSTSCWVRLPNENWLMK